MARSGREYVVMLATVACLYAAALTEVLGLFHALAPLPLAIGWGLFAVALCFGPGAMPTALRGHVRQSLRNMPMQSRGHGTRLPSLEWMPALAIAGVLIITLVLAVACPPSNWDVILYHLPRQVQWAQQQSVAHFPTQDYRLTVNPPFAEYLSLHAMVLTGSDRFNAIVSWCALALTLVAVSLVARELGVNRLGQWLAAAVASTIPMAIHEAASGKNDGLVAFWFVMVVWWLLRTRSGMAWKDAIQFGACLGLLALTKGTGVVLALPVVAVLLARAPLRKAFASRLNVIVIALVLNSPHLLRNEIAYGSFAGQTFGLDNARHDPKAIASNVVRNVAMHLATPNAKRNAKVEAAVERVHTALGITSNEPTTTWGGSAFHLEYAPQREHATAPGHLILLMIAMPFTIWRREWLADWIVLLGGFALFCVAFKWQPWHPRLHLPLLTLASVAIGSLLSRPYVRTLSPLVIAALLGIALPALVSSEYRPLPYVLTQDSESLRFHSNDDVRHAAETIVALTGTDSVDLVNHGALPWEYPLTRLLKKAQNRRVGYFYPVPGSPWPEPAGCVIDIGDHPGPRWLRHETGRVYERVDVIGPFTLYRPAASVEPEAVFETAVGRFGIGAQPPRERNSP